MKQEVNYNPQEFESKWQKIWEETGVYRSSEDRGAKKVYILDFFPYPSGEGLHVGHARNYTISDIVARHQRMQGKNVLHPMGWDAFGLPAENYAIKTGISPQESTKRNTANYRRQLKDLGISFDWSREINSSDPSYYRWTQWLFLLLFERGLAYQKESEQWWCETDKTVLANEQVEGGKCWRCGNLVSKKLLKQWFFKITEYADRLLEDLDTIDWPEGIKLMQRNWIGRSEGAEIIFDIAGESVPAYTTRPDTLAGATFLVLAPEHPLVKKITTSKQAKAVAEYTLQVQRESEIERQNTERKKTGVWTGVVAKNPLTGKDMPVWIADYVLMGYGTGAIMAVPGHDERDYEFAKAFDLPIIEVVTGGDIKPAAYPGEGALVNSGSFDGLVGIEAKRAIVAHLFAEGKAKGATKYRLRDWLISRQRYWGAPIPIIHCPKDGAVAVPEDQLPVVLPVMESYLPSGDGHSPLAISAEFVNTTCPKCGGPAKRETDTMDGFACSSWYFLRFADPHNDNAPFAPDKMQYWLPVDMYIGGAEHAVMHLLYARFWTKVLHDAGLLEFTEPFKSLRNQGMLLAADGRKMSKSYGNVINPDKIIADYGADTLRLYEMFMAPYDEMTAWSDERLNGVHRFVKRFWGLVIQLASAEGSGPADALTATEVDRVVHKTIKRVHEDFGAMRFNTAISALMECVNTLSDNQLQPRILAAQNAQLARRTARTLTLLIAPLTPHLAEELWQILGNKTSVHIGGWPQYDPELIKDFEVELAVQVNGKLRGTITVAVDTDEAAIKELARAHEGVVKHLQGKTVVKTIVVPRKIVNFVVKP